MPNTSEVNPPPCGVGTVPTFEGLGRPDTINEHLIALLQATGVFAFVVPTRPDVVATPYGDEALSGAWIYYFRHEDEAAEMVGAAGPTTERMLTYHLAIEVRSDDELTRLRRLSRLDAIARNTLETSSPNDLYRVGSVRVGPSAQVAAVGAPRARWLMNVALHARIAGAALRDERDREDVVS